MNSKKYILGLAAAVVIAVGTMFQSCSNEPAGSNVPTGFATNTEVGFYAFNALDIAFDKFEHQLYYNVDNTTFKIVDNNGLSSVTLIMYSKPAEGASVYCDIVLEGISGTEITENIDNMQMEVVRKQADKYWIRNTAYGIGVVFHTME